MENIEHQTLTTEFYEAWKLAIETVISIALPLSKEKNIHFSLLRDHLNQPFIEHFSFRFGNQIFFCCVHTEIQKLDVVVDFIFDAEAREYKESLAKTGSISMTKIETKTIPSSI